MEAVSLAHYEESAFRRYEQRLAALEAQCLTDEERQISLFVIRIVRSLKMTLWLTNGAVKWLAAPIGIFWGLYAYGANFAEWVVHLFPNVPR